MMLWGQSNINREIYSAILNGGARLYGSNALENPIKGYSMQMLRDIHTDLQKSHDSVLLYTNSLIKDQTIPDLVRDFDFACIASLSEEVINFQAQNCQAENLYYLYGDEDALQTRKDFFSLIISDLSMHFARDIRSTLLHYMSIMQKDGILIANILGRDTLCELQDSMMHGDLAYNRMVTRTLPTISIENFLEIARSCGFRYTIATNELVVFEYKNIRELVASFREIGQVFPSRLLQERPPRISSSPYTSKRYWKDVEELYREKYSIGENIKASVRFITLLTIK